LMFLFLCAPDIAITQIVVEVLGLIILIRATIARDLTFITGDREFFGTVVSVVIVFVIFLAGTEVLKSLPQFGTAVFASAQDAPSVEYIGQGLSKTGAANLVSSVILDFRAYDTLGEATVLFTSIIGATVILRSKAAKKLEEADI
jgi:multicomponent Na+:H+ antiporter subunit B